MKKQIIKFLEWLIRLFGPSTKEAITAWPFPVGHEPQLVEKKTKPRVAKATTRPAKKAPAAIKTAAKKTAKKAK